MTTLIHVHNISLYISCGFCLLLPMLFDCHGNLNFFHRLMMGKWKLPFISVLLQIFLGFCLLLPMLFDCHGNLNFFHRLMMENGNCRLFLCYCRYFWKSFTVLEQSSTNQMNFVPTVDIDWLPWLPSGYFFFFFFFC